MSSSISSTIAKPDLGMAINYFAYGSNMASERLLARIPGARKVCNTILHDHRLRFRKSDNGKSGKCDIEVAGKRLDRAYDVVERNAG